MFSGLEKSQISLQAVTYYRMRVCMQPNMLTGYKIYLERECGLIVSQDLSQDQE